MLHFLRFLRCLLLPLLSCLLLCTLRFVLPSCLLLLLSWLLRCLRLLLSLRLPLLRSLRVSCALSAMPPVPAAFALPSLAACVRSCACPSELPLCCLRLPLLGWMQRSLRLRASCACVCVAACCASSGSSS